MSFDPNHYSVQIPTGVVQAEGDVIELTPYDLIAPEDQVVTQDLKREIKAIEPNTFALLPGTVDPEIIATAAGALFNEVPELGLTREESAHEVMFGQLIVKSLLDDERAELISVKPFDTPNEVAHEFALSSYFSDREKGHGFRTFVPIGIVRMSNGEFGLMTQYDHGVRSLDNVLWNPEHELASPIVGRAIGKTAYLLASMHASGWTHGDAQVKNMFVSNHEEVFVGDLESTRPFAHRHGSLNEMAIMNSVDDDLRTLAESFTARREEGEEVPRELIDLFGLIYNGITNSPNSLIPHDIRKTHKEIRDFFPVTR